MRKYEQKYKLVVIAAVEGLNESGIRKAKEEAHETMEADEEIRRSFTSSESIVEDILNEFKWRDLRINLNMDEVLETLIMNDEEQRLYKIHMAQAKIDYQLESAKDSIIQTSREVKDAAERIKREMEDVISLSEQVESKIDEAIHFLSEPWGGFSFNSIAPKVAKLDTLIKSYNTMKRILELQKELEQIQ